MSDGGTDLDTALRRWGDGQRRSGSSAPRPPAIADLLAARRRRHNVGAVAATVVLVAALAAGLGFGLQPAARDTPTPPRTSHGGPPATHRRPCSQQFADGGSTVDSARSKALVVLRYLGTSSCTVFERPQLALLDSSGRVTGPHAPSVTLNRAMTIRPGETVRFSVTVATACVDVPGGDYSLLISLLPTGTPSSRTGIEVAHDQLHLERSIAQCTDPQAGVVTGHRIVSSAEASTLNHLTRIARREAVTDGDPSATAEAVRTTYGRVEPALPHGAKTLSAGNVVWVVQVHGDFGCAQCLGPPGSSDRDYVLVVLQEPGLRYSDSHATGTRQHLSKLGPVLQLIP